MIEYIYFVKCPNCEDEHFDFFDEAKEYALGCLSKNPIITQVEVCRNDFGECTDSKDLGTIWSSDYVIADVDKEPSDTPSLLTKDFLNKVGTEEDPEFAALDNSVDVEEPVVEPAGEPTSETSEISEISAIDEVPDNFRKPLTEGNFGVYFEKKEDWDEFKRLCDEIGIKTMGDVERFMGEQDATPDTLLDVLRDYRADLGPDFKIVDEGCRKPVPEDMTIEQLVETMEENEDEVECTWCNELYPKDECRYEVNLGYLCPRCEAAIKSRGETLTFRENNYWDFLDEEVEPVAEPRLHTWTCWYDNNEIGTVEAGTEEEAEEKMINSFGDEFFFDSFDHDFRVTLADEELAEDFDELEDKEAEESVFENAESVEDVVDILVKDEEEAIATYEEAADKIEELASEETLEETKEILDHIKEEEEEHIEELETLVDTEEESLEEHVNEEHPAIESDQELVGTDNAVVDCKVADVVTHSEDEKPVDCEGEKEPLEKPLTEVTKMTKDELISKEGTDDVDLINAGREPEDRVELAEATMTKCPECGAKKAFDKESGVCNNCGYIE